MDTFNIAPKRLTLVFLEKGNEVLLGLKKRGFGKGLWNGFGGKVESGESIVEAAQREVLEECGLEVNTEDLEKFAEIDFEFINDPVVLHVHVFKCRKFTGEPIESDEMLPKWFPVTEFPFDKMWPDDKVWYPLYLKGLKFKAYFLFHGYTDIVSYDIRDYNDNSKVLCQMKQSKDSDENNGHDE